MIAMTRVLGYDVGMSLTLILAFIISTIVPLIALWLIRTLDLYGTGAFRTVIICFMWGIIAFGAAYGINTFMVQTGLVSRIVFERYTAPIIEEILKSLILLFLVRRANFTYFVDGAIYGFAAGIGFAIVEDYSYVLGHGDAAMGVAIARVLSTNLMHASASAMIGIAVGWARFHKEPFKLLATLGGYAVSMGLHIGFNTLVTSKVPDVLLLTYAIVVGFVSAAVIATAIRRGLAEEKAWIKETLGEADRVTAGEAAVVHNLEKVAKLLTPIATKFGKEKSQQAQKFLTLQAQLGIKRKTLEKLSDENMLARTRSEMDDIRHEMEEIRRSLGTYIMLYIRNIFPPEAESLFGDVGSRIEEMKSTRTSDSPNAFAALGGKLGTAKPASSTDNNGGR